MEWGKIFASGVINKGLIPKIYKQLIQLIVKKKLKPIKKKKKKRGKSPKQTFSQRIHTDGQ